MRFPNPQTGDSKNTFQDSPELPGKNTHAAGCVPLEADTLAHTPQGRPLGPASQTTESLPTTQKHNIPYAMYFR